MSTGIIGVVQYLSYLPPLSALAPVNGNPSLAAHVVSIVLTVAVVAALWRRIDSIANITKVLWVVMLASVILLVVASFSKFNAGQAFNFGSFSLDGKFLLGLGGGLLIGVYDYLGYNTASYIAEEVKDPGRVLPRAIVISILAIMAVYIVMNIGVLGVLPTDQIAKSSSVASSVLAATWGTTAAYVVTVLIVVTGVASVFCGLLGASRLPFNAALDKVFFRNFGYLHPQLRFPRLGLIWAGAVCALGTLFTLSQVISAAIAVLVIVQAIAQVLALIALRANRPDLPRPYRMWLYPLPAIIALVLWTYVWVASGLPDNVLGNSAWVPIYGSLAWLAFGVVAFLVWARLEHIWPFGPNEIQELPRTVRTGEAG
jgi:amino acid transporter